LHFLRVGQPGRPPDLESGIAEVQILPLRRSSSKYGPVAQINAERYSGNLIEVVGANPTGPTKERDRRRFIYYGIEQTSVRNIFVPFIFLNCGWLKLKHSVWDRKIVGIKSHAIN
jgi:hypothetical protein